MIANADIHNDDIHQVLKEYWGFDTFRPLQEQAIAANLDGRDAVVVVPTGGGKSLCYQLPAAMRASGMTVVVSPLLALMKDQVDSLRARGISAAYFNSSLDAVERREVESGVEAGAYRLLYVAPERFGDGVFVSLMQKSRVATVAIDEAHCISQWGHDFRPDYRRMAGLRDLFPEASIQAFTATATPRVREDIVEQLHLRDASVLVGNFDRPNLTYRVLPGRRVRECVVKIVEDHPNGAGIIYCIRRKDVDELTAYLRKTGCSVLGYHAGMDNETRRRHQDAFAVGEADIIVATVAFGMGIDRSDVRYIIHVAMPQSVEHYQQETGRAGRDGAPADTYLFHGAADAMTWRAIFQKGNVGRHNGPGARAEAVSGSAGQSDLRLAQLRDMESFCQSTTCRHMSLCNHFGQFYGNDNCGACDICLGEIETMDGSTVLAQKILSAVVRTGQRYGSKYLSNVLCGAGDDLIAERGHESLNVHGILSEHSSRSVSVWISQLLADGLLAVGSEYRTFSVTEDGWSVLRGNLEARLLKPLDAARSTPRRGQSQSAGRSTARPRRVAGSVSTPRGTNHAYAADDGDDIDMALFKKLRTLRHDLATERSLPDYFVMTNRTLEGIARAKPSDEFELLEVPGIGNKKMTQYGQQLLDCVRRHVNG
jgi:ATP-dependent DNA helicase RecQ